MESSVITLEVANCPNLVYFLPTPKSPHGVDVDPTGEFIVGGGKLATVLPVHSFTKMLKAIADQDFDGEVGGIPVLRYEAVMAGEVQNPGLGPLHTEFDGKGFAYTSVFLSSEIIKWSLADFTVVDRIPTYYSIGSGHRTCGTGPMSSPDISRGTRYAGFRTVREARNSCAR
jgi:nitrous-oxide reductase